MEERTCPNCGRKFKVAEENGSLIVIPKEPKIIEDCPECGRFGKEQ